MLGISVYQCRFCQKFWTYGIRPCTREASIRDYEVEALHNIGVTHEAQGNYSEALTFELEALALRQGTILHRYMVTYNSLKLIGFPKLFTEEGKKSNRRTEFIILEF